MYLLEHHFLRSRKCRTRIDSLDMWDRWVCKCWRFSRKSTRRRQYTYSDHNFRLINRVLWKMRRWPLGQGMTRDTTDVPWVIRRVGMYNEWNWLESGWASAGVSPKQGFDFGVFEDSPTVIKEYFLQIQWSQVKWIVYSLPIEEHRAINGGYVCGEGKMNHGFLGLYAQIAN